MKCTLSTLRIDLPCRSDVCTHNQCYDALSFLQLQEQAPTWTCPICNKSVQFESLRIDGFVICCLLWTVINQCRYFSEILSSCPRSVEQVTIEPNGKWSPVVPEGNAGHKRAASSDGQNDDEDLVEIQEPPRLSEIRNHSVWTPPTMSRTPPHSSREPSINSSTTRSSAKRPVSAVIDLTNSSDEEEPPRPPKRHSAHHPTPNHSYSYESSGSQRNDSGRPNITFSVQTRHDHPTTSWQNPLSR